MTSLNISPVNWILKKGEQAILSYHYTIHMRKAQHLLDFFDELSRMGIGPIAILLMMLSCVKVLHPSECCSEHDALRCFITFIAAEVVRFSIFAIRTARTKYITNSTNT